MREEKERQSDLSNTGETKAQRARIIQDNQQIQMEIEMIITYSKTLGNDAARHCYPRRDLRHLPIDQPRQRRRRRHPPLQTAAAAAAAGFDASNKSDLRQNPWLFGKYYYLLFTESEVIARRNYVMSHVVRVRHRHLYTPRFGGKNSTWPDKHGAATDRRMG